MHHIKWFCHTPQKGVLGLKQRRSFITIITSLVLSVTFVAGCARRASLDEDEEKAFPKESIETQANTVEAQTVSEPFYNSEKLILEAPLPVNESGLEATYFSCEDPIIAGNHIFVRMYYAFAQEGEPIDETGVCRWCIFDFEGNYVTYLQEDFLNMAVYFDEDAQGMITVAYADYDYTDEAWSAQIYLARFDQYGQLLKGPVFAFSDTYSNQLSLAVNDKNGEVLVASQHMIMQLDADFQVMTGTTYSNDIEITDLWEEQGEFYVEMRSVDENFQEYATINHVTVGNNGYISVSEPAREASNLLSMRMYQTNTGIYAATRNALGKLDLSSGEFSSLLDWNQTDIDRSLVFYGKLKVLSEGSSSSGVRVIAPSGSEPSPSATPDAPRSDYSEESAKTRIALTSSDYIGDTLKPCLYLLTQAENNPHEGQDVLWVGGIGITSSALMSGIARYNSSNSQNVWVKVYDYAGFNYTKSYVSTFETQKALERMAAQLSSGTGPDIIIGAGETGIFDNSSILTDLNGYVDGISGINRDDYFNSALESFETDGKLYQIPLVFSVRGLVGNRNMVNGKNSMNYSDYIEARNYFDESAYLFSEVNIDELCNIFIEGETGTWINYSNGRVSIDHEKLKDMLNLLMNEQIFGMNGFIEPEGSPLGMSFDPVARGCYQEIFACDSAFAPSTMNTVAEYAQTRIIPGVLSWYGYPGSQGSSMIIQSDISVGISSASTQKEKAWEVIKFFLEDEVQTSLTRPGSFDINNTTSFIPLSRDSFHKVNGEEDFPEQIDTYALDVDGSWITCYAGEREDLLKEYEEALNVPMRRYIRDPEILYIVKDTALKYFYEECSADDAAYEIEKRIIEYNGR